MKKVSLSIPKADWGHIKSKYPSSSAFLDQNDFTSGTKNVDTTFKGVLYKRQGGTLHSTIPSAPKDQYEAIFSDGTHHLLTVDSGVLRYNPGDGSATSVTSGYSSVSNFEFATAFDRVYFCNGVTNQVYDKTTSYGGVTYTAPQTKVMGCQAPAAAPTAAVVATGSVPVGGHTYKVTFLYYGSEESNGGPATAVATTTAGNQKINLTSIPVGGYGVTARKIYRDNNDGVYVLITTISDNSTTTYSDTSISGGADMPTDNSIPPTSGLILTWLDRLFFAKISGDPYSIYFSDAGLPDIVQSTNFFKCNQGDPITGFVVFQDRIIVFNRGSMGQIMGRTSDAFRYASIQGGVGCVDNRSVQVRVINGVPTLVWLSDKGVYGYNGSSVSYLSDPIEDLVNFNIQQAQQTLGSNTQTSQADFQAGTASNGIDLTTSAGLITTPNPKRLWDDQTDWEGGSSLTNVATKDGTNLLKAPIAKAFALASGSLVTAQVSSNTVRLPTVANQTVPNVNSDGNFMDIGGPSKTGTIGIAQRFVMQHNGTIPSILVYYTDGGATHNYRLRVYADAAGLPDTGTVLKEQTGTIVGNGISGTGTGTYSITFTTNLAVTADTYYWVAIEQTNGNFNWYLPCNHTANSLGQLSTFLTANNGSYVTPSSMNSSLGGLNGEIASGPNSGTFPVQMPCTIFFTQTAIASSGQWLSDTYDSSSASISTTMSVTHTGTYPATTSGTTTVEGSDNGSTWDVTQAVGNVNGTQTLTVSGRRYWRVRFQLSTTDNRNTPVFGPPTLKFATTGTWISEAINCTSNVSAYNSLDVVSSAPAGTSVTVTVATSDDNVTYTSYGAFGSATVKRYMKVKVVLTTDASNVTTPSVTSITLKWTIAANLVSQAINTGSTPAGWDIFQAVYTVNGGTIQFSMRSGASLVALAAASYTNVTSGAFPSVTPNQYVQWKVIITSTADAVPTVDSATINWFIGNTNSIRVASLFYNRAYYLATAEYNNTTNNVVLVLDAEGKWRVYRGLDINTFSLFFNKPYYGRATAGQIIQYLSADTDQGTNIEFDVRTKAFDFANQYDADAADALKILRSVEISGVNTGATITPYYSIDEGTTWKPLYTDDGASSIVTTSAMTRFIKYLSPSFADGTVVAGRTVMLRFYNNDAYKVEIHKAKMDVTIRKGKASYV